MTAVPTISASGEHLDASTLALLAEVELDEMSIRALSDDLATDIDNDAAIGSPSDSQTFSADETSTVYPWTTSGLLEAAKHLGNCNQCTTDRTALLASFTTSWQETGTSGFGTDQALMDRQIATALAAFDETITAAVPAAPVGIQKESTGFLGAAGKQKSGSQASSGFVPSPDSGSRGRRTSGFGRAIGLRRNQVLIGFATLAVAVPLLLQLRPNEQFGGAPMKASDTTASASETTAASAEFAAETQALAAETTAASAAETVAAAAVERSNAPLDTLARIPAANLDQVVEPPSSAEVGGDKGLAAGAPPPDLSAEAVAETEAAAAAIDVETDNVLGASLSAVPTPTPPPVSPSTRPVAPSVKAPAPLTTPAKPLPPTVSPASPNDAAAKTRAKDAPQGAVGSDGSATAASPVRSPTPESNPTPTRTQAPKPATKAKKAPSKGLAPGSPSPSPAATAAPAAASAPQLAIPVLDPTVLNLGNVGPEIDPAALISRFRAAYDRVRPQPPTTLSPAPTTFAPAAPAVAAAPAAAVSADPVFAETGTPTAVASQTVERCVTNLFGATDRQIIAAASANLGNRPVWVVRVQSSAETVDVIIKMSTCAELLRQPVS